MLKDARHQKVARVYRLKAVVAIDEEKALIRHDFLAAQHIIDVHNIYKRTYAAEKIATVVEELFQALYAIFSNLDRQVGKLLERLGQ